MASRIAMLQRPRTMFLILDLQTRFRPVIYGFDRVAATTNKMLKVAKLMNIPVVASEQSPSKLGRTVEQLDFSQLGVLHQKTIEKTKFSMMTEELEALITSKNNHNINSVVLMGIESHICVLQTALDFLQRKYNVYVLADGVSSCNKEEVPLALDTMRQAGAQITTSESIAYQLMQDASEPEFRELSRIIKEETESTRSTLQTLLSRP